MITAHSIAISPWQNSVAPGTSGNFASSFAQHIKEISNKVCHTISSARKISTELAKTSTMNIMQFGPQIRVFNIDLKGTATAVITRDALSVYPLHLEVGKEQAGFYLLSVHQWGMKFTYNGSFNPKKWKCEFTYEKLEHLDKAIPYAKFGSGAYQGSVQCNFFVESGMTTIYPENPTKNMLYDTLCRLPTAICEFGLDRLSDYCYGSDADESEPSPVPANNTTIAPLRTTEANQNITVFLAEAIANMFINGIKSNDTNKVFWLNFGNGPVDINAAITWHLCQSVSISVQTNNYLRFNFTVMYIDGKISFSGNIKLLTELLGNAYECCQKWAEIHKIAREKTDNAGVPAKIVNDFCNEVRISIEQSENDAPAVNTPPLINRSVNQLTQPEFLQALAKITNSYWIIKDTDNNFLTGYDPEGDKLIQDLDPADTHHRYILGATESVNSPNITHLGEYKNNYDVLVMLKGEPLVAHFFAGEIMKTVTGKNAN